MNFLFKLAGAVVYRIVHEYREIEERLEGGHDHIILRLANGDEFTVDLEDEDDEEGFEFGFRPSSK